MRIPFPFLILPILAATSGCTLKSLSRPANPPTPPSHVQPGQIPLETGVDAYTRNAGVLSHVYFRRLDGRDLYDQRWGSYPRKLQVTPGKHVVEVTCEIRGALHRPPLAADSREFRIEPQSGQIHRFIGHFSPGESSCQIREKAYRTDPAAASGNDS